MRERGGEKYQYFEKYGIFASLLRNRLFKKIQPPQDELHKYPLLPLDWATVAISPHF